MEEDVVAAPSQCSRGRLLPHISTGSLSTVSFSLPFLPNPSVFPLPLPPLLASFPLPLLPPRPLPSAFPYVADSTACKPSCMP